MITLSSFITSCWLQQTGSYLCHILKSDAILWLCLLLPTLVELNIWLHYSLLFLLLLFKENKKNKLTAIDIWLQCWRNGQPDFFLVNKIWCIKCIWNQNIYYFEQCLSQWMRKKLNMHISKTWQNPFGTSLANRVTHASVTIGCSWLCMFIFTERNISNGSPLEQTALICCNLVTGTNFKMPRSGYHASKAFRSAEQRK